ncbi:MAG: hypothetical protein HYY16_09460 [Planctomycetes bacterium]|nr:hypothetical protein [Planctomycetota bacterium]
MIWLRAYIGSIIMAFLMAIFTWVWLYSESTATRPLEFEFKPRVDVEFASIRYEIGGVPLKGGNLRIEVTGPRGVVETLRPLFPCAPVIGSGLFTQDEGKIPLSLQREEFRLPPKVEIKEIPQIDVRYVKYVSRVVRIVAETTDTEDDPVSGWRVASVRALPSEIHVNVPADRVQDLPSRVPIERISVKGRTGNFIAPGRLRTDIPVKAQDFHLEVALERAPAIWTIKDVALHIALPPEAASRVRLRNPHRIEVKVEGPTEAQEQIVSADLYAYVRLKADLYAQLRSSADQNPGFSTNLRDFGCDIINEKFRDTVKVVEIMSDQDARNREATVDVLPGN